MKLTVELDFWFDTIDLCSDVEIKQYLIEMFISGADSTCSDVKVISVKSENGNDI